MINKYDLKNKTALITGAAGLMGMEHAGALLECGCCVVLTDINDSLLVAAKERLHNEIDVNDKKILTFKMDISSVESIKSVNEALLKEHVRVDILVKNAALDPKVKESTGLVETSRIENFPLEQWNLQIAVGLTGALLSSQIFGSLMASDGKGGVIINISSDLGIIAPYQRLYKKDGVDDNLQPVKPATYSVIKAGLIGLTKYLSTYWADKGVRSNALSPGGVFTNRNSEFVGKLENLIPMGRMAAKDEYRGAIQFLCSDASKYMNGKNLVIDGARTSW